MLIRKLSKLFVFLAVVLLTTTTAFAGEKVYFYTNAPDGTPIAMRDGTTGDIVWQAYYKPFGEEHSVTGSIENNKRFIAKELDVETGLIYINHRYYSPEIGRFITPEPIGSVNPWNSKTNYEMLLNPQRLNPYAYGLNNPYKYIDASGKFSVEVHRQMTLQVLTSSGFSQRAAARVAQGNVYVDRPSNQLSNYQHSMRDIGQTRDEAVTTSYNFSRERLIEAGRLIAAGDYERGLFVFGEGLHTVQDRKHNWITLPGHGPTEYRTDYNPTPQQETRALSDTAQYLKDFWSIMRNDLRLSDKQISTIKKDIERY